MKNDFIESIREKFDQGSFADVFSGRIPSQCTKTVADLILEYHGAGKIDAIREFSLLNNATINGTLSAYTCRQVFDKVIPGIDAPVQDVMACVLHMESLHEDNFRAFVDFLSAAEGRARSALNESLAKTEELACLIGPILEAGSKSELESFHGKAVDLLSDLSPLVRQQACIALGAFRYEGKCRLAQKSVVGIQKAADQDSSPEFRRFAVFALARILIEDKSQEARVVGAIQHVLGDGESCLPKIAVGCLQNFGEHLPTSLSRFLMGLLRKPSFSSEVSATEVDHALYQVLTQGKCFDQVVEVVAHFLANTQPEITLVNFQMFAYWLKQNGPSFRKILTRWFIKGDFALCNALSDLLSSPNCPDMEFLAFDVGELPSPCPPAIPLYLARKAIGFCFLSPVKAAKLVLSAWEVSTDKNARQDISGLLFNPLLVSYSGELLDYLKSQRKNFKPPAKKAIGNALSQYQLYLDSLRSVGQIPELRAPDQDEEAYHRFFGEKIAESFGKAMKGSLIDFIACKKVMLYGRMGIFHQEGRHDQASRTELPLKSHGTTFENPHLLTVDPVGFDYCLRVFRNERIVKQ